MNNLKNIKKHLVSLGIFGCSAWSSAGSYDEFFKAIQLDQPSTVQRLLQRGFDPNTVAPDGVPALMKALQEQSFDVALVLGAGLAALLERWGVLERWSGLRART